VDTFQAVILGLVQGLTEFLPVSSSGHLVVVPWLFNWETTPLAFDAALHLGTLLAVLFYFRVELWKMVRAIPVALRNLSAILRGQPVNDPMAADARLGVLIAIGCIPGGVVGLLFETRIDDLFHNAHHQDRAMLIIAALMAGFGLILYWADRVGNQTRSMRDLGVRDSIIVGLAQAIALLPGTSRSGVTLSAGLFRDLNRADAARFSFLLGFPLILAAGLTGLKDLASSDTGIAAHTIVIGIAVSAISGLAAISWLIRLLQRATTTGFVIYRLALAAVIVILIATGVR
jgi:undecaprenyl-diphosphatase